MLRECVSVKPAGIFVNMLFDVETPELTVQSPYPTGLLILTLRPDGLAASAGKPALWVRVPSWAAGDALRPTDGSGTAVRCEVTSGGAWLFIPDPPVDEPISLAVPLASSELVLQHRTRAIRCALRGDEVARMEAPAGADLTFFEAF